MKIFENIYLIPGSVNCYIIEREQECVMIDTGMSKKASKIIHTIESNFPDKPLKAIFVTHSHVDHIMGLETLKKSYNPSIIAHKEESPYVERSKESPGFEGFGGFMVRIFEKMMRISGFKVDKEVEDNEEIHEIKVMHMPGHTPGTIALIDIETQALFCGDIINSDTKNKKILPPKESYALDYTQALKSSIRMLEETSPSVILPGHGPPIFEPDEAIKIYLDEYSKV
jgi:glyoxylase-like metal-dependent hydrolase (beta-lactamase superfamily II)